MPASANRVNISIDLQTGWCRIGSQEAYLGNRERQLFGILLANRGKLLTKGQIAVVICGVEMSRNWVADIVRRIRVEFGNDCIRTMASGKLRGYWIPNGDTEPTEVANNPINPLHLA